MRIAGAMDAQGEIVLAGGDAYFAEYLPPVLTDRERIATELIRHMKAACASSQDRPEDKVRERTTSIRRSVACRR
jgi:hypothetical protein